MDLPHIAARVFGTPLMIARAKLDVILGVLAPRLSGALLPRNTEPASSQPAETNGAGIAVVSIVGTLVARSGYLDAESGLLSYGAIGDTIDAAIADPLVRGVILDIDSPGGEVGGLFDLAARIVALRESGKPLWAVANEDALSAAYAIASAADRIYVTQTGEVGSIGVVAAHIDESGADTQAGLAWSFIFAGDQKVDGNAHAPLSPRARAAIQDDVDRLYDQFCHLVSANRGLTADAVRATQAATYRGALAIRAGLADRLGPLGLAISEMAAELEASAATASSPIPHRSPSMSNETIAVSANSEPTEPQTVTEAAPPVAAHLASPPPALTSSPGTPAALPAMTAAQLPAAAGAAAAPDPSAALRAEYAEIASLTAQAARLGVSVDAADAMRKGVSADALRRTVLDTLASRSEATTVIAAVPTPPSAAESPIVRRARERASAARS